MKLSECENFATKSKNGKVLNQGLYRSMKNLSITLRSPNINQLGLEKRLQKNFLSGFRKCNNKSATLNFYCIKNYVYFINNCPTRCNTKQSIYYSASSLYMFQVSTTPIIRSTQNCNYSLLYCAATSLHKWPTWLRWREVAAQKI